MSFDGLVMRAVKDQLHKTISGGRIEKIYQPRPSETLLLIHKDRTKYRLLISSGAGNARVHLTTVVKDNPLTPPMFCMVLRKHIEGGKITSITQAGLERVLTIDVEAFDELGELSTKKLICEVMGKHSNIILLDPTTNIILDGINRFSYATSRHREVLPGRKYSAPPESGKADPLTVSEDRFRSLVWNPEQDTPVERILLESFDGFSPQTCREIVIRAGLDQSSSNQSLGELELNSLWSVFRNIRDNALALSLEPTIYYEGIRPVTFSAIRLTQFTELSNHSGTVSEILDEFFATREKLELFKQAAAELIKVLNNEIKKCQKKIAIHTDTLKKAKDAEKFKTYGELITANIYRMNKGDEAADLENYYDPEARKIMIPLNPQLAPAENAQAYFKKYAKAHNSISIVTKYLDETSAELEYLESVVLAIEQAEQKEDLTDIRAELTKEGYLKPETSLKKTKKPQPVSVEKPSPMLVKSEDGFDILVGRNNRQNDYLTLKLAGSQDTWLHVKDIPGSHVVIRNPEEQEIPGPTLQQAAQLAAYYSKARNSSKVPVDYTLKKHVRKPKGAKPGMVIYDNQQTILVEPKLD